PKLVSCTREASGAPMRNICAVFVARLATIISRFAGCHEAKVRGRNSVYGATLAASAAEIGGIPSALGWAFGATTPSCANAIAPAKSMLTATAATVPGSRRKSLHMKILGRMGRERG